jgi:GGDEF domain-containing protein
MPYEADEPIRVDAVASLHPDARLLELRAERELRLFRVSVCAVFTLLVLTAAWFVPWGFVGMSLQDFDGPTTTGVILLAASGAASTAFAVRWAPMLLQEPKSEVVRAFLGDGMRLRSRTRFLTRLRYQCELRLKDRGQRFSLVVIDLPKTDAASPDGKHAMTQAFATIQRIVRGNDVIGDSGGTEAWILLMGAGLADCGRVCRRIAAALREDVPGLHDAASALLIGAGAFETDGRDADAIFRAARKRATAQDFEGADVA